ncbi:MAG: 4'-phosphopantetheinyl transferase family protein [Microbacter sp.]
MLIQRKKLSNNSLIGIWQISETEEQLLKLLNDPAQALNLLNPISNALKRCEKLAVRALLKALLGEEKTIVYNESGKPFIEDNSFKISISHTDGFATVMIHPSQEVGIDIEIVSGRAAQLQKRFLNTSELLLIHQKDDFVVPLLLWTAKEALYKWTSNPNIDFVKQISIIDIDQKKHQMWGMVQGVTKPVILSFEINENYVLTYVIAVE